MNDQMLSLWNDLQSAQESFIAQMLVMNGNVIAVAPSQGWSALQVLEHIIVAEKGTLGYMKKKSSGGWDTLENTSEEHRAASLAVNNRLRSDERYAAPSVLPEPLGIRSFEEFISEWKDLRHEMEIFVSQVDPVFYEKLVFKQPIAGMLNLKQALQFMTLHILHHIPQIQRLKIEMV